jgi:hypothetical protein
MDGEDNNGIRRDKSSEKDLKTILINIGIDLEPNQPLAAYSIA